MEQAGQILQLFDPISLNEMDGVKLMNRTDTKYTFNYSYFEAVMNELTQYYRVLEIEGKRLSRYQSLYYDTPDYTLYKKHQNGKLNRHKIRHRTYVESEQGYLEVKFKNNKGRTLKDRIKHGMVPYKWEGENLDFLKQKLPFDPQILVPVLWINYSRLTLVNKENPERLTIDLGLEFVKNDTSKKLDSLVIAEVKQDRRKPSPFMKVMKKYHIREGSISKYCMGMAMTIEGLKQNNFKRKLISLKHKI